MELYVQSIVELNRHATYNVPYKGEIVFSSQKKNLELGKKATIQVPATRGSIDIIAGGFPCQPFSRAGVSARESLGQTHGFKCETQGQLFFDVIKLAKTHKPKVLLLENVGNLLRHYEGNTFRVIK